MPGLAPPRVKAVAGTSTMSVASRAGQARTSARALTPKTAPKSASRRWYDGDRRDRSQVWAMLETRYPETAATATKTCGTAGWLAATPRSSGVASIAHAPC